MSIYFDVVLLAVNLAVNLILLGFLTAVGTGAAFKLIGKSAPRIRYVITVAGFLMASIGSLIITLNGTFTEFSASPIPVSGVEERVLNDADSFDKFTEFGKITKNDSATVLNRPTDLLNDFTYYVSQSSAGKIFLVAWIAGAAGLIFRQATGYFHLRKMRRTWRPAKTEEKKILSCPADLRLYFIENEGPCTVGWFRPAIILPRRFPDDLTTNAVRQIIEHEISHARWFDPLVNFLLNIIYAVFWISPALWLLKNTARTEQEVAADFAALAGTEELSETSAEYAASLIAVAKFSTPGRPGLTSVNLVGPTRLENRIRRILTHYKQTTGIRILAASIVFAAGMSGLFFVPTASQSLKIFQFQAVNGELNISSEPATQVLIESDSDQITDAESYQRKNHLANSVIRTKQKAVFGTDANKDINNGEVHAAGFREKPDGSENNEIGKDAKFNNLARPDAPSSIPDSNIRIRNVMRIRIPRQEDEFQGSGEKPADQSKKFGKNPYEMAKPYSEMSEEELKRFVKKTFEMAKPYLNKTGNTTKTRDSVKDL